MAAYQKFNQFVQDMAHKVHALNSDSLKVLLCLTAPVAANSIKTDLTEIAAGAGYSAGGAAATTSSSGQTAGTYKLVLADLVFTSTGAFANFRYPVLYNDTPTSPAKPLIGFWDYGSTVTLANTETFTTDFDNVNGVLQVA